MKKFDNKNSYTDMKKELCVVITVTNWDEVPRMRHEITHQLIRKYNVLYLQLFEKSGVIRRQRKISDGLIIDKIGFGFPGIGRIFKYIPILKKLYNFFMVKQVRYRIKQLTNKKNATLFNFQYDFPEINSAIEFTKKIYYCNDDFVNQNLSISKKEVARKRDIQSKVISGSTHVITVSYPLKDTLSKYTKKVNVILSGHNFDLSISKKHFIKKSEMIKVCYMGFLNEGIATEWLIYILKNENIHLTIIGPIGIKKFKDFISKISNVKHINYLTGTDLQYELLEQDVLLMPYSSSVENEVTTVPAKLFQYLAVGKPIVSSTLQNLVPLPDKFVYKSDNKEFFMENIIKSKLEDCENLKMERITYSSGHNWESRGDELFKILGIDE